MNISPANIRLELASFRGQALSTLMNLSSDNAQAADFASILGNKTAVAADAAGRNTALKDPESAYKMMSKINNLEVNFKAQYAELSQMGSAVEHMEEVGNRLSDIDPTSANADIKAQMQDFVTQYNEWVDQFSADVQPGGVLNNIQAADISRYELEQSVKNIFNGAADGINGLGDLGISIDAATHRATFDSARLDATLASNKNGVVNAIDEFSANFAKSADLLNSAGNFIPNAQDNRSRAISYIADNLSSLQTEFGTGNAAQPTGAVAKALSAYDSMFNIG